MHYWPILLGRPRIKSAVRLVKRRRQQFVQTVGSFQVILCREFSGRACRTSLPRGWFQVTTRRFVLERGLWDRQGRVVVGLNVPRACRSTTTMDTNTFRGQVLKSQLLPRVSMEIPLQRH